MGCDIEWQKDSNLQFFRSIQAKYWTHTSQTLNLSSLTREYGRILDKIRASDLDNIFKLTKCTKPCKYKKYNLLGDMKPSLFKSEYVAFSLWAVSENTRVSTEQLIYPISSLVAEFGGTLSLFLGVSFVTIWDNFHLFGMLYRIGFKKW